MIPLLVLCMILCADLLFAGTALDQLKTIAGNPNVYVPEPPRPSPRPASYGAQSGGGYSSSSAAGQAAIAGGVMQSVFSDIMGDAFSDSPQQASQTPYVDPALIKQRELGEKQRLRENQLAEEERRIREEEARLKRQEQEKSLGQTMEDDKELLLNHIKSFPDDALPEPSDGDTYSNFFGTGSGTKPELEMVTGAGSEAPPAIGAGSEMTTGSAPLTAEERERLRLKNYTDSLVIDPYAFRNTTSAYVLRGGEGVKTGFGEIKSAAADYLEEKAIEMVLEKIPGATTLKSLYDNVKELYDKLTEENQKALDLFGSSATEAVKKLANPHSLNDNLSEKIFAGLQERTDGYVDMSKESIEKSLGWDGETAPEGWGPLTINIKQDLKSRLSNFYDWLDSSAGN